MFNNADLINILHKQEFELFDVRSSFRELGDKFYQLENAFAANMRILSELERERKQKSHCYENSRGQMTFHASLTRLRVEKKRWKEAFLHQRKITERQKLEHEKSVDTIRCACEKILKNCRQTGEKHFRELLKICESSQEKAKNVEEASLARESSTKLRILDLANFFGTLEKMEGVRIELLCQRAAKALRSLVNDGETGEFAKGMKALQQVTWDTRKSNENWKSLDFLETQNSVLRQIVKSLKKKIVCHDQPEDMPRKVETDDTPEGNFAVSKKKEEASEKYVEKLENKEIKNCSFVKPNGDATGTSIDEKSTENVNDDEKIDIEKNPENRFLGDRVEKHFCVDTYESHKNGIPYVEYTFRLFGKQKFCVRHAMNFRSSEDSILLVQFVETEEDFHEAPIDRMVFYLGENARQIGVPKKFGLQCGVQTSTTKTFEKFVQTSLTGTSGFSRVNAGLAMLNSEKRAIERSLKNLETTVESLKNNTLDEAHSMIGKATITLSNEFFDCIQRLER